MANEKREKCSRLKRLASQELINTAYKYEIDDADILFDGMSSADIAHVVMLLEENIIPKKPGKRLLQALLDMEAKPAYEYNFHPKYGDTYTNREQYLKQVIGKDTGWLHVGRARRECSTIGFLLATRERLLSFSQSLVYISNSILYQAEKHVNTIMSDFTYLQHAQPTSLAHYLLTFEYSILRDLERIRDAFHRLNQSPAGCGSVNGSRFPLNRQKLSDLLGFETLAIHTRDAMWRVDIPIEIYAILVASCININRLVEELQIWATCEFNMIELPDEYCRTSVIMPQKKNPYCLSFFRGLTGLIIGRSTGIASIQKAVSGQPDNRIFTYGELPRSIDMCIDGIKLIGSIIKSMKVNKNVMYRQSSENFSTSTDIAEVLMIKNKLDYASSHHIVGTAVRLANEKGFDNFTIDLLNEAAELNNEELNISEGELNEIIKPELIIETRKGIGGAGFDRVSEMIQECKIRTESSEKWINETKGIITIALENLRKKARELIKV